MNTQGAMLSIMLDSYKLIIVDLQTSPYKSNQPSLPLSPKKKLPTKQQVGMLN